MKTYAVYLEPKGSLVSELHSDTLFGAICWAIRLLQGAEPLEEMLANFNEQPQFLLSSAFPYLQWNDQIVRFFPKPQLPELQSGVVEELTREKAKGIARSQLEFKRAKVEVIERLKDIKKIAYVSEGILKGIVVGQVDIKKLYQRLTYQGAMPEDVERIGNALITTGERKQIDPDAEIKSFLREADVQRNQIDRVAGSTVEGLLFFDKQTFLRQEIAGLWFILRTDDLETLKPAFRYLEDTGIGGERTVGKGHFAIPLDHIEEFQLPDAGINADCFVSLSRYLPQDGEISFDSTPLSYTLLNLRAKHESMFPEPGQPIYKKQVRLFVEGSIFPLKERRDFYGRIVEVDQLKGRTVWQNGMALPLFARIGGGK